MCSDAATIEAEQLMWQRRSRRRADELNQLIGEILLSKAERVALRLDARRADGRAIQTSHTR